MARLGSGDCIHAWLCHSRYRIATISVPQIYEHSRSCVLPEAVKMVSKNRLETEVPREDRLAAGPRGTSSAWAGRPSGTARWPTCLPLWLGPGNPDTPGGMLFSTLSLSAQGHVSWLGDADSKHPPVCVGGKHRCLGTGMSTMGQQISDDLSARAHCNAQASGIGHC